ncbi:DNA replication licensing factor MCM3 [Aphelenchoides besseyi]|nr:DNA replication licensing factor MCM3 [Aphelenchoides besseyi]KAI6210453.1 DNA replication licensing factor MCM3 [Aphelenchoides besseyi]
MALDQHNYGLLDIDEKSRRQEIKREYVDFLDDKDSDEIYVHKIEDLVQKKSHRLIINMQDIRRNLPDRYEGIRNNFVTEIIALEEALKDMISRNDPEHGKDHEFCVGFEGEFGDRSVNPRSLKSEYLGHQVCCEGIVTRCSNVRPKVEKSVHYCPATKKTLERQYTDLTSYESFPSSNTYPKEDENKNPLETEFGLSVYKDHQVFSIQELPELSPPGQLPRSVDVIVDDDLADACKPGDRVKVVGLFRVLPNKQNASSSGNFRSVLIANNIVLMSKEQEPKFDNQDIKNIKRMGEREDIVELLARSLAPSIFGHEEVKKAVLCLLLGGSEKVLDNGSRLRGDINVLLIGDPSVAKSQVLRYVLHTAPRVVATTGRGSSGVGLTAAVTTDPDSGERRLEAGAMVLADRGIVCIDEFDKMTDIDRTAIHEVMEQGRVSISKAGIHAKLNARCSVLAAANPVFGRYDLYKSPMANIGLQDSLLSRFDLIFVMLDEHEIDRDRQVAENVLKLHAYRAPGEADGAVMSFNADTENLSTYHTEEQQATGDTDVFEKNRGWTAVDESYLVFSSTFLRKYIHMAKRMKPALTTEASAIISEHYVDLRSHESTEEDRTMPVTARQLETLIRLSIAMAKARLSPNVEKIDVKKAYDLLYFAMFKKKSKERMDAQRKNQKNQENEQEDANNDENMEVDEEQTAPRATRRTRRRPADDDMEDEETAAQASKRPRETSPANGISFERLKRFRDCFRAAVDDLRNDELNNEAPIPRTAINEKVQEQMGRLAFSAQEFEAAYELLVADNTILIGDDDLVYTI